MPLATPDEIVAALKDYRLKVVEWPGWRTRGRPYPFDPYGQAWHHDAFGEQFGDADAARYMTEKGRPDLPPPLCNGAIGNFGTVYLCAYGNANHAGRNEADVHARLKAGKAPLGDARSDPDGDTVVGNSYLWGWECRNAGNGQDPWDQLDVMMRAGAAMADCCDWNAMASAGHRELTARKPDPVGFDMTAFRAGIARAQAAHNAPTEPEEDDLMQRIEWFKGAVVAGPDKGKVVEAAYRVVLARNAKKDTRVMAFHVPNPDALTRLKTLGNAEDTARRTVATYQPNMTFMDGPFKNAA